MKKTTYLILTLALLIGLISCAKGKDLIRKYSGNSKEAKLDTQTIVRGLKEALQVGARNAVNQLGATNGYFKNRAISIPFPPDVRNVETRLRKIGLGSRVDEFILTMNRAAEEAAPKAFDIFIGAIKGMSFEDARNILYSDNPRAATDYFEGKTRPALYKAFYPVVSNTLDQTGVTKIFQFLLDKYNSIPFIKKERFDLKDYVNNKALDGLFTVLAQEEKKIRKDPAARINDLLKKVFGS
jgi:hypothetical protein